MKSLSSENQEALKDMIHEHAKIQKELEHEVTELTRDVLMGKFKMANLLTTQNTKILEFEDEIEEINEDIKNNYNVTINRQEQQIENLNFKLLTCHEESRLQREEHEDELEKIQEDT